MGHSWRSKRCFTKIYIPLENKPLQKLKWDTFPGVRCLHHFYSHLAVCGLRLLPAPFLFAWHSGERRSPSKLRKDTDKSVCVCMWETADLSLWNKKNCTVYTRSHFKTALNQVAEDGFFWTLRGLSVCSEPSKVNLWLSLPWRFTSKY